jgi:two-component system chemotaxis sensor kinase CheA
MARRRSRPGARTKADKEFVSEAEEILERMRLDLVDLGEQHSGGGEVEPDLVNRLFRSAHSLKGLAGLFGVEPVHDLAHHLEDVLDGLRLGRVALGARAVDIVDRAVGLFADLLGSVGDAEALGRAAEPAAALVAEIEALKTAAGDAPDDLAGLDIDPSMLRALTEYEEHRLRESLRRGRHVLLVDSTFDIIAFEEGLSELSSAIRQLGEILSTLPAPGEAPEAQIRFSLLVASDLPAPELQRRLEFPDASVRAIGAGRAAAEESAPFVAPSAAADPRAPAPPGEAADLESLKSIGDTVRVDIRKLDELMNLVGELVIQRGALGDLINGLLADSGTSRAGNELLKVHKSLDRKLRELQASVLEVRMVPLRQVFEKISRVVRRLRHELDKDVRLELRGADTELDKLIVEELVDPLMHIVRNALDHAIEAPEERRAAGKPEQGSVRIEAFQRGNHVVVAVSDDGRGIDAQALRARAEERGILEANQTLGEKEVLDLIFVPGISTRSEVTETSGRGVGMDVVRTNITQLGGVVDVQSLPGRGSTISMTLPITLAIIQSLIVAVDGQRFAIPLNAVHETLQVEPGQLQRSEDREVLNLRGDALLLRRLADEFGLGSAATEANQCVVVLGMGDSRMVRGISGATDLGDQDPVLVLDVSALLAEELGRREAA